MAEIKGLFFDQDGVIVDTERDGHRVAFNETFKSFGFNFQWSVEEYHDLLQIAGGKERMAHYLHTKGFNKPINPAEEEQLIKDMHKAKTSKFIELIESGKLPLRPGIKRLMKEANHAGILIGICTTSDEKAAKAISTKYLNEINFRFILAGDVVDKKKPDPAIYLMALQKSQLKPEECVVIEDSKNGVLAAKGAGIRTLVTTNPYTEKEDLSGADIILTCLGDPNGEKGELVRSTKPFAFNGVMHLQQIKDYFQS